MVFTMATAEDEMTSSIDMTEKYDTFVMTYANITNGTPIMIDNGRFLHTNKEMSLSVVVKTPDSQSGKLGSILGASDGFLRRIW